MKKLNFIIGVFLSFLMTACGSKYDSYRAACDAGDFEEALNIAEKLNEEAENYGREHSERVFSSAMYSEKMHYYELKNNYETAIEYIKEAQAKVKLQEFLKDNDYEAAANNGQYGVAYNILSKAQKEGNAEVMSEAYRKQISQMYADVLEKELKYLLQQNTPNADTKVLFLLKEQQIKGNVCLDDWTQLCDLSKELALAIGKEDLAEQIEKISSGSTQRRKQY